MFRNARIAVYKAKLKQSEADLAFTHDRLEEARRTVEGKSAVVADLEGQLSDMQEAYLGARADFDDLDSENRELLSQIERMNRNWDRALRLGVVREPGPCVGTGPARVIPDTPPALRPPAEGSIAAQLSKSMEGIARAFKEAGR